MAVPWVTSDGRPVNNPKRWQKKRAHIAYNSYHFRLGKKTTKKKQKQEQTTRSVSSTARDWGKKKTVAQLVWSVADEEKKIKEERFFLFLLLSTQRSVDKKTID